MLAIRTILHPTDFSDSSNYAFRLACSLARDCRAKLVILHVTPPPVAFAAEGMLVQTDNYDLKPIQTELQHVKPGDTNIVTEHRLVEGDAATEIMKVAGDTDCDMIVVGTHGRTGLGRLLMGSVAEQLVRQAPCPVLTVRSMPERVLSESTEAQKMAVATV